MRIVIDTKNDSPEEIKHVINMLTTLIGEKVISTTQQTEQRDIFGNIFGPVKSSRGAEKTEEAKEEEGIDIKDFDLDKLETY